MTYQEPGTRVTWVRMTIRLAVSFKSITSWANGHALYFGLVRGPQLENSQ